MMAIKHKRTSSGKVRISTGARKQTVQPGRENKAATSLEDSGVFIVGVCPARVRNTHTHELQLSALQRQEAVGWD